MSKSFSWACTLYDDESTREKYTIMDKSEIMSDDARNPDVGKVVEDFLEFGKTYRITITELGDARNDSVDGTPRPCD